MPNITTVSGYAFTRCAKLKGEFSFPNCTEVGISAFSGCAQLEGVFIPKVAKLNNTTGSIFYGCANFKSFIWDFPDYSAEVPSSCFAGCSSLSRIDIKTAVSFISGSAFKDIAPGAEIYMPAEAPATIGENAFSNTKDCISPKGPTQRIYLKANYDAWLEAFRVNHHIIMLSNSAELAAFNAGWSEAVNDTVTRTRDQVIDQMERDPDICAIDADNGDHVTIRKKGLLAYAVRKHTGTAAYSYGCWIFKLPEQGFKVIVR